MRGEDTVSGIHGGKINIILLAYVFSLLTYKSGRIDSPKFESGSYKLFCYALLQLQHSLQVNMEIVN